MITILILFYNTGNKKTAIPCRDDGFREAKDLYLQLHRAFKTPE